MVDSHQRIQRNQDFFGQTCSGSQCRNAETEEDVSIAIAGGDNWAKNYHPPLIAMHCLTSHWKSVLDKGGLCKYLVTIVTIKIICAALFVIRGFVLQEKNDDGEDTF